MKTVFIPFFIISLINIAFAENSNQVIQKNGMITISLPANPTTGYQWQLKKYDKALLKLQEGHYQSTNSQLIGSGGQMIFKFKILSKQKLKTEVQLEYARPWEKEAGKPEKIAIELNQ